MSSGSVAFPVPRNEDANSLSRAHTDEDVTPNEIAVGVIIGRSSEYFDFFSYSVSPAYWSFRSPCSPSCRAWTAR